MLDITKRDNEMFKFTSGTSVIDEEDFVAWAKNLPLEELSVKLGGFTINDQRVMAAMEEQAARQP